MNKFLLNGDKFMTELILKESGFTDNTCGQFTKHRERIQKVSETDHSKHLYRNKLDKLVLNMT